MLRLTIASLELVQHGEDHARLGSRSTCCAASFSALLLSIAENTTLQLRESLLQEEASTVLQKQSTSDPTLTFGPSRDISRYTGHLTLQSERSDPDSGDEGDPWKIFESFARDINRSILSREGQL